MALINCKECNKEISDKAIYCPGCGFPLVLSPALVQSSTQEVVIINSEATNEKPAEKTDFIKSRPCKIILSVSTLVTVVIVVFVITLVNSGGKSHISHISIRDTETGVTISLGMTRVEVERLIGRPIANFEDMYIHRNHMVITYADFERCRNKYFRK